MISYGQIVGTISSIARIVCGLVCLGVLVTTTIPILIILLPSRVLRIRVTNVLGTWMGRTVIWWSGSSLTVSGMENVSADRPAIYACNHTSILDAFTTVWLTPSGTVGVAKKEVFFYPFYGQVWWLAGHLFLDRKQTKRAKEGLRKTGELIRKHRLHLCILPEGTRSTTGRLLPFKKGIAHIAIQTRLPIVPMITTGLQNSWRKSSLQLTPCEAHVKFLPPVSTEDWTIERIDEHLASLRDIFVRALPADQKPFES